MTTSESKCALAFEILKWIASYRTGLSSENMAFCALGLPRKAMWDGTEHPEDPDDFNRCLLLLEQVPEIREYFPSIAKLSPQWSAIIENWDRIEKQFISEAGLNWQKSGFATVTYALMREVLDESKRQKKKEQQ